MDTMKRGMSRRGFHRIALLGTAAALVEKPVPAGTGSRTAGRNPVRLGGPVFVGFQDPDAWIAAHRALGYSAALCPVNPDASEEVVEAFRKAAAETGLVIAEVGAWSNPIAKNAGERNDALAKCISGLALADRIGARCCVNISGSRGDRWDGPDPENLTEECFALIVDTTRAILDAVKPTRTFFTLETMPWAYPDSPDSYVRLLKAVDRKRFGVHLDHVNMVSSPERYFRNGDLIRECFKKLGPSIRSCHAKDILLSPKLTTHLDEVRPGIGALDYAAYLTELSRLPEPPPLILEHLPAEEDYRLAADYIRAIGEKAGIQFVPFGSASE